jgi:hypothetical protein
MKSVSSVGLLLGLAVGALQGQTPPSGFTIGIEMPSQTPVTPAVEAALRDLGVSYLNYYVKPWAATPEAEAAAANEAMLGFVDRLGCTFSLSCYTIDPPDACVQAAQQRGERFRGIVFDELEHCRQLNPHEGTPTFTDPLQLTALADAYEKTLAGYTALYDKYASMKVPVVATHVFPVLHHVAARAGFAVCPKIQKEFYSPVSLAIGMGAALQYGRELWADADLWYYDLVPGHSPEELWCNLLLAYWLGVDTLYLEGCGHNLTPPGKQGIPFSLMTQVTPELYQLTAHGETLRRFIREYLPRHPRPWTFRDVQPTIAIIRFPDSDYGQRFIYAKPANGPAKGLEWHAGLYGSPNLPSNPDTEAWFDLWNLLTDGATGSDGITFFKVTKAAAGYERPVKADQVQSLHSRPVQADSHRFFVPLNNVVVFDHRVGYERLREIPLLFLTGVEVSAETLAAARRCAEEGATLVVWGNLARRYGFADYPGGIQELPCGKGRIILTDTFSANALFQLVWPQMGRPDEIRYRFGAHTVVLKRVTDNQVDVQITPPLATAPASVR